MGSTLTEMATYICGTFSGLFIVLATARIWYFIRGIDEAVKDGRTLLSALENQIKDQVIKGAQTPNVVQDVINTASKFSLIKSEINKLIEAYKENTRLFRLDILSIILLGLSSIFTYLCETQPSYTFYKVVVIVLTSIVIFEDLVSTWRFYETYSSAKKEIIKG
jgi:hypothetical protein